MPNLNPKSSDIKFEHTVGSHYDDRDGGADLRCTCPDELPEVLLTIKDGKVSGTEKGLNIYIDQQQNNLIKELLSELPDYMTEDMLEKWIEEHPHVNSNMKDEGEKYQATLNRFIGYNQALSEVKPILESRLI